MNHEQTSHLTNEELISQLTLRDDLTELETDLLDRLIRSTEEVGRLEDTTQPLPGMAPA